MKIKLDVKSIGLRHSLAEWCAETIYHARIRLHLLALSKARLAEGDAYTTPVINDEFRDVQALIRGIKDPYERLDFVITVKMYFRQMWEGQHARTRDYVESVRNLQESEASRQQRPTTLEAA